MSNDCWRHKREDHEEIIEELFKNTDRVNYSSFGSLLLTHFAVTKSYSWYRSEKESARLNLAGCNKVKIFLSIFMVFELFSSSLILTVFQLYSWSQWWTWTWYSTLIFWLETLPLIFSLWWKMHYQARLPEQMLNPIQIPPILPLRNLFQCRFIEKYLQLIIKKNLLKKKLILLLLLDSSTRHGLIWIKSVPIGNLISFWDALDFSLYTKNFFRQNHKRTHAIMIPYMKNHIAPWRKWVLKLSMTPSGKKSRL